MSESISYRKYHSSTGNIIPIGLYRVPPIVMEDGERCENRFILSKPYKWLKRCERRHKHNCIYLYKQSGTQESVVEARRLVYM